MAAITLGGIPVFMGDSPVVMGDDTPGDLTIKTLTMSSAASFSKGGRKFTTRDLDLVGLEVLASTAVLRLNILVTSTPAVLDTGGVTSGGLLIGKNRGLYDVCVRIGVGGEDVICFPPKTGHQVFLAAGTPYVSTPSESSDFEYAFLDPML